MYIEFMDKQIRPVYFELQGYLSQAPNREIGTIFEKEVWEQYNQSVDELETITSKKYDRYRIRPESRNYNGTVRQLITTQAYRTILGGLISRLHGEYFSDEPSPIIK